MAPVLFRIGLFISSFSPLYLLLLLDNYEYLISKSKLWEILLFNNISISLFFLILFVLIIYSIWIVSRIKTISLNERQAFEDVNKTEDNLLSYVVTYLVPILSINILEINSLLVNAGLFLLLGFIYVKNSLVYLNPLFLFFGFNIFLTSNSEVLISDYSITELKQLEHEKIWYRKLSYKIYLIRKTSLH
ncbi:hypothetical protein ATL39_0915 [Sinobaca qinghaiensis]|uniref:Uncharacterized protein n=1 Tax=Sinobaca qinghaiensis TaxID=342944 RepID=A0A419V5P6_9BACL|nr:hypothetical protein [Sinobaca qinghaiensis]RKD75217.1 hypothetical protein ATL39_0915 [Sinobaca qinghaiensis]